MALTVNNNANLFRLLSIYNQTNNDRALTLARLSTGKRINRASEDPAGLIALKTLESEMASVDAAIENNQRTRSMLNVADGALTEVSSLLSDIEALAVEAAGGTLTASEKAANQAQIDSALDSIDRIVNNATFNGQKLFGGANSIATTMSVADAADVKDVRVYSRNPNQSNVTLTVNVTAAAAKASTSGTSIANVTANLSAATTVSIAGKNGTATITLASGSSLANIVSTINSYSGLTGVSAAASGTELRLDSTDYGSEAFVSINAIAGDVDVVATANTGKISGTDATVLVNGQQADTSGVEIYYSSGGLSMSATLASNTTGSRTITVVGGGATFQLGTDSSSRATIGLDGLTSSALGRADLGYLSDLKSGGSASLSNDPSAAVTIAKKAVNQVASSAARVGGFMKYQVEATNNALNVQKESLSTAASDIGDADMALEMAKLERQNLLASTALSLLGTVNVQNQNILALFRGL